jgi:translation elongation factor EF-Tu-like GTPase
VLNPKCTPLILRKGGGKMEENKIGEVIKFFGNIGVAAIRLSEGSLKVGDTIRIVGHTSDFTQPIDSMQVENKEVKEAGPGADIGIKVKDRVREHDVVYKVVE